MRLSGKTAIITGGTTGIGRAAAGLFAREGARVVIADWRDDRGGPIVDAIVGAGGVATFVRCDVRRRDDNERLIAACVAQYGRLDILFCNAGRFLPKLITESSDEEIEAIFDVNVKGLIYASRAAIPQMLRQGGGTILFDASIRGLGAQPGSPIYCASKGAAVLLARALALDYATQQIRVNALCPGIVDTPMLRRGAGQEPDPVAALARYTAEQPIGRLATPEECAAVALWLVSDEASFVTGVAMPVDGGLTAR
ncbi:MAG TPA: glucose 1-dehydrogenase [Chloroflexia bacterium]|nr:glucose 1-dehydrogenase [Chloroflexia bacterium]